MLNELISKAKEIESGTNANFQGALIQVTQQLSIEAIESLAEEMNSSTLIKNAQRTREGKEFFNINGLRNDVFKAISSHVMKQKLITERAKWAAENAG